MLNKFTIEYVPFPHHNDKASIHRTSDPVEAEDFLKQILLTGSRIIKINHDGCELTQAQFDRMVKVAAERLVGSLIGKCLDVDAPSIKHRFGFAV